MTDASLDKVTKETYCYSNKHDLSPTFCQDEAVRKLANNFKPEEARPEYTMTQNSEIHHDKLHDFYNIDNFLNF